MKMEGDRQGRWALIVHGGAKEMKPGEEQDNRNGILEAAEAGAAVLRRGGSAVDSVEAAIRVLERLPVFNAGYGSVLNDQEEVEMCAGIMDGRDRSVGAVGAVMGVKHPVSVAKLMLPEKPILLAAEGALMFAKEKNAELVDPDALITERQLEEVREAHDTVGAVALDMGGNIAAGTSTGGLNNAHKGRIGDSPMPGCGYYADNHIGGVAFSGDGESIARLALAAQVMARINDLGQEEAIEKAVEQLPHLGGDGGGIAIAREGRIGWAHNSPAFVVAKITSGMDAPEAWLNKQEEEETQNV
ncbi:MAG TPA: isoaspartyl peptidase/L-asparaginase family protein [Allosphingosinicella sp.]|jgi:beta-aspartyl-peptidase (threonine type)|nr:isoaspartyl peptidase/L-asparaginase family protein [Allosphingosinicella sp.]